MKETAFHQLTFYHQSLCLSIAKRKFIDEKITGVYPFRVNARSFYGVFVLNAKTYASSFVKVDSAKVIPVEPQLLFFVADYRLCGFAVHKGDCCGIATVSVI